MNVLYVPAGGLVRLRESLSNLTESELTIADYILKHPFEFVNLTVHELAERSGGSTAAVVRLWKALGFEGFQDFKIRVASDLQLGVQPHYQELQTGNAFNAVVEAVQQTHRESIRTTLSFVKEESILNASRAILQASRVLAFGVAASGIVAKDFAQKLLRIGYFVQSSSDFHDSAVCAAQLGPGDVLVAVSYSGCTSEVYEVAEIAIKNGAEVIAITSFSDTPLSRIATVNLFVSCAEPQFRVAATASRISALTLIDVLFIHLAHSSQDKLYPVLESTGSVVQSHKII